MADTNPTEEQNVAPRKREMQGLVVRKSGDKTVAVEIVREIRHPIYQKKLKKTKRYLVHDPKNEAEVGQMVLIREVRPMSARKRWIFIGTVKGV